jgi:formate hydrogenlyase subunit 6/NADH:ubiquinone oxidoreductase subunit I
MHRRAFLRKMAGWVAAAAAVSGGSWLARASVQKPLRQSLAEDFTFSGYVSGPLRPPGAVEESLFRKRCTGCFLCGEVCPVKAIRFVKGAGLASVTPLVVPSAQGCILCMRCTEVCPTEALLPMKESEADKVRMGIAVLDKRTCLPHIHRGRCEACFTVCPFKGEAIVQKGLLKPEVIEKHCVGCGLCEEVCPVPTKAIHVLPHGAKGRPARRLV